MPSKINLYFSSLKIGEAFFTYEASWLLRTNIKSSIKAIKNIVTPNDIDKRGIQNGIANKPGLISSKKNKLQTIAWWSL